MYVPHVIKVTLQASERQTFQGAPATFTRVIHSPEKCREAVSCTENRKTTDAAVVKRAYKPLDTLLTLGVRGTVDYIKGLACPSNESASDRECLETNVCGLAEGKSPQGTIKIRNKDAKILKDRIGSIIDFLSFSDATKLMFAISQLEQLQAYTAKEIAEHVIKLCETLSLNDEGGNCAISLALALTSLEHIARKQAEIRIKGVTNSTTRPQLAKNFNEKLEDHSLYADSDVRIPLHADSYNHEISVLESQIMPQDHMHYGKILVSKIAECVEASTNIDVNTLILLVQAMANTSIPAAEESETIIRRVPVDDLNHLQLCTYIHESAVVMNMQKIAIGDIIEKCMAKLGRYAATDIVQFTEACISQAFHAFYLTGNMDTNLMFTLANHMASNRVSFKKSKDFYRIGIPLSITGQLSSEPICLWLLNQLAANVSEFSKETSHFIFLLTSIANNVKMVWKRSNKLSLQSVSLETDIYEKAETYLRQQEGERAYFSSPRAAMLFLIEKANSMISSSSGDDFLQILLLNCAKNFKADSRIKFELLKECKKRVKEIPCRGVPQVLQTLFVLFSPNAPELVEVLTLYMDRIITEIECYNDEAVKQLEGTSMLSLSFLEDINIMGNVLAILDRCNLNRGDLAMKVIEMLERTKYKQLESATFQALVDLLHYLSFSLDKHDAIDIIAILIQQRLKSGTEASDGQLAATAECFIAAPLALNKHRHKGLIEEMQKRAKESKSASNALNDILNRLN
ncbi:hypothetical protein BgAZ_203550 [Babesia gibsoni]|uniref:Uncharacterized protein n=1 Tax=Babesia gibsoni TaxID=33632 RepID=A0AAD8PDW6_BABGI|nr:hypothetical protein BgAZ_203550 [Babesia gibsoni]